MAAGFDNVIDNIYRAGVDATQWGAVLAQLTERLQGAGAVLHVGDTDCSGFAFGANHNIDPEALDCYAQHYFAINPLNPPLTRQPAGAVVGDHMLVRRREYKRTEFFNDYARRFKLEGSATAVLSKAEGQLACLAVVQPLNSEPYSRSELALLTRLLPHLQRAIELNRRLAAVAAERDQSAAALDYLEIGVIFLGKNGTVLRANLAAEQVMGIGRGLALRGKRLEASDAPSNSQLQAAIDSAVKRQLECGGCLALPRAGLRRPLLARVIPYITEPVTRAPAVRAIMFVRDPDTIAAGSVRHVTSAYGLTRGETRVVEKLLEVSDLKVVADQLEISEVTVRNHLARAMAKTDTRKQSELVRVILSSRLPLR